MNDEIFAELNKNQQEAVKILSGPLLILAGAGSGKTKTLTHRVANLIANGTLGHQILAVTFTNKAANEMKGRIEKLLMNFPNFNYPEVGTFHSICVRILRQDIGNLKTELSQNFIIFDSSDSQNLIKLIIKDLGFDDKQIKYRAIASHISSAKNNLLTPIEYAEDTEDNRFTQAVKKIFPEYQKRLQEHNALDFDDLLQKTVQLFEKNADVLTKYRDRWKHYLVDEYQDTNFAQYRLTRLLSDDSNNLCVIGDDHQSIYSFRGADYSNILNFEKDFPDAKVIKLEQNYRSSANILSNANSLISFNRTGHKKNLWTDNKEGELIEIREIFNERSEGDFIAQKIKDLVLEKGLKYSDFAVLYRMNAQSRAIEEAMIKNQIPYQIVGGTKFFDRREIKDLLAYLRLIFNPRDDLSFLRIINIPTRKLGSATLEILKKFANNYSLSLFEVLENVDDIDELNTNKKVILSDFREIIKLLRNKVAEKNVAELLEIIIEKIDFMRYLDDGTAEGESRQQNVRELFTVANKYSTADSPLASFLEGVALISDLDNLSEKNNNITLMTVHASKGLEFPCVFLPAWENGIFPSNSSQYSNDDLEEERRLGYVAITRAKDHCFITYAKQRTLFGMTNYASPSQFIDQLDENCIRKEGDNYHKSNYNNPKQSFAKNYAKSVFSSKTPPKTRNEKVFGISTQNETDYKISDQIKHNEWGQGTIIQVSGDVLTIAFSGIGVKKVVASITKLEKL